MVERRTPHAHIKLYRKMQQIAPRELKMDYDNVGLLIGPEKQEIRRVLVALDCTSVTAKEAIEWGADLMLTHHPVFFRGTKRIAPDDPATAGAYMLIRHGIGLLRRIPIWMPPRMA